VAVALACACCLLVGSTVVRAQSGPRIEVNQFGWKGDGTVASRTWNPVSLRISGGGATRVQVVLNLTSGNGAQTVLYPIGIYAQDVALVQGGTREVKLWVPLPGDGAYVATGSVVTSDVPADALTIGRARQVDKPGRASELRERLRGKNK